MLTKHRNVHQTSLVQKAEDASSLAAAVEAAFFVPSTSAPATDILAEKISFQYMEHFAESVPHPQIPPQPGNFRPTAQPLQPVTIIPPPPPQQLPRSLYQHETP